MRVVSENSEAELAQKAAMAEVYWALRELTANLLRVTRGAGSAGEIARQAQAPLDGLIKYREAVGIYPSLYELADALAIDLDPEVRERLSDAQLQKIRGEHSIIRGSLQIAASRLLGQRSQETAGDDEMYKGLIELEAIRAKSRSESAKAARAAAKSGIAKAGLLKKRDKSQNLELRRTLPASA